jgi:UDP-N-acetylmuramoyl-L-alanyl-D-glutamate--2,6-diaminopimelate ligase
MWQKVKNIYHFAQAFLASIYFGFPSKKLTVIAVTGTDGKTTTVNMIYHILKTTGKKVSMVSSLGATIGNESQDTGYHVSTPSPFQVQKLLKEAVDAGSDNFILEATSHGLDQNRLAFVKIKIGVVTNITDEHMNYHKTWINYAQAKAKLFKNVEYSILNKDDKSYAFLKNIAQGKIMTYSLTGEADITRKNFPLITKIAGQYNIYNALAASAAAFALEVPKEQILKSVSSFSGIKGRLQEVKEGQQFRAVIDFAHTANGLEQVLKTLHASKKKNSKLIAVFGSAGDRDRQKREIMGTVASKYADISIITAEDPRSEDPTQIAKTISAGFKPPKNKEGKNYFIIPDRTKAIDFAAKTAEKGDIVAFLGKGHENSMCIGDVEYPWSEEEVVKKAIKALQK